MSKRAVNAENIDPPDRATGSLRERLLYAAFVEFANYGFQGASLRRLCGRVGVHHSNVRHLFQNKAKLLHAVQQDVFGPRNRERQAALDALLARQPEPSVAEIWDAFAIPTVRFYCHPDGVLRASLAMRGITEHEAFWPSVKEIVSEYYDSYLAALVKALGNVPREEANLRFEAATNVFVDGLTFTSQNVDEPEQRTIEEIRRLRCYALAILHDPVGQDPAAAALPDGYLDLDIAPETAGGSNDGD